MPAANIVPPKRLSLMKIARIGSTNPKPVKTKTSEKINKKVCLFITKPEVTPKKGE